MPFVANIGIFVVVYLNIVNSKIQTIPNVKPPDPLIKLLAALIAVGVEEQHPCLHTFPQKQELL